MADISLIPGIQSSLQATRTAATSATDAAQRLALGRAVLSALDGAQAFSQSLSLNQRAQDLLGAKNEIDLGISSLRAASEGLDSVERLLQQAKGVAQQFAGATTAEEQARLQDDFDTIVAQVDNLVGDTSFLGRNLIGETPGSLSVGLDETGDSTLVVDGRASDSTTLGLAINEAAIDSAIATVRANQSNLSFNVAVLQVREAFTEDLINTVDAAAADLVAADLNEQAALAVSSQTRQQLGVESINVAANAERSILSLF